MEIAMVLAGVVSLILVFAQLKMFSIDSNVLAVKDELRRIREAVEAQAERAKGEG
jgi:hypothetical protein